MWHVRHRAQHLVVGEEFETAAYPEARGIEVESGALLLYDEFGKVITALAPGTWVGAWQEDQPTPSDPSAGGAE